MSTLASFSSPARACGVLLGAVTIWSMVLWLDATHPRVAQLLIWLLVAPVCEELVFRGWLQPALAGWIGLRAGPITAANLISGVLFAMLHLANGSPSPFEGLLAASILFGWLRERSGGLALPIGAHLSWNGLLVSIGL